MNTRTREYDAYDDGRHGEGMMTPRYHYITCYTFCCPSEAVRMPEITHRLDPDTNRYVQVVTPARLREILDDAGEDYTPPSGFCDADEWDVERWGSVP